MHEFSDSLAKSHTASDLPIWEEIYQKAFPSMLTMVDHRQDGEHQRAGIDRSVILENSKQILIDEKARFPSKNGFSYPDILLEHISNDQTNAPGWTCKPLRADYICYAITGLGQAYLLPVLQLQQAWKANSAEWIKKYGSIPSINNGYKTWNTPLMPNVLFSEIGKCLRIQFTACNQTTHNGDKYECTVQNQDWLGDW